MAEESPGTAALLPGATLTLSCQSRFFACLDPAPVLPALSHPSCLLAQGHHLPVPVVPLEVSTCACAGAMQDTLERRMVPGHFCSCHCLSWQKWHLSAYGGCVTPRTGHPRVALGTSQEGDSDVSLSVLPSGPVLGDGAQRINCPSTVQHQPHLTKGESKAQEAQQCPCCQE